MNHYNCSQIAVLETNLSDWIDGSVLSQYDDNDKMLQVAFHGKNFVSIGCNYEIYNKELLVSFCYWEH